MRGAAAQAAIASGVNHTVRLPRARRPASYSAQLVTRCRCFGMWRRQAALALNGTAGGPSGREGDVVLHRPAPDATRLIRATRWRAGRDPADRAREFEPSAQAIRNWVAQADRQDGRREVKPAADASLSVAEREELSRLRRENKQLRLERDILSRATAWFARETGVLPSGSSGS